MDDPGRVVLRSPVPRGQHGHGVLCGVRRQVEEEDLVVVVWVAGGKFVYIYETVELLIMFLSPS